MMQQPTPPPIPLVDRISASIAQFRAALPSLAVDESIDSDLSQHGFYRARTRAQASLRVTREADGGLRETRTFVAVDGKPVAPDKKVVLPFNMHGAFSQIENRFFGAARRPCFTYSVLPEKGPKGTLQVVFRSVDAPPAACPRAERASGVAQVDAETAQIVHLEETSTENSDEGKLIRLSVTLDLAPTPLGDQSFWLPGTLSVHLDGDRGHFVAHYTNFHRYTGSVTILPAEGTPEPPL